MNDADHDGGREPQTRGARLRLRLLPLAVAELGPLSPELALVSPELADAARAAIPGDDGGTVPFDTPDLLLRSNGVVLERSVVAGGAHWRLVLPRGETIEAAEENGGEPPPPIGDLLGAVAAGEPLLAVPWYRDDPDVARLREQVGEQRAAMLRHDPGTRLGVDPENLHQFRVAGRRLRAFLRLARTHVDPVWAAALRAELSDLGRVTGPVRDLDVLLEHLHDEVANVDPGERATAQELLSALRAERDRLQAELRIALAGPAYLGLLARLAQPLEPAERPAITSLRKRATRELRRLVRDVEKLGASPADDALHALRLRVKRVRYAVELAGRPARAQTVRVLDAAKELQDLLGEHQDTVVAERLLAEAARRDGNVESAFVAGRLAERQRLRRNGVADRLPAAWRRLRRAARRL
jgi:CHAD domain-containing protein